jgi:phosphoglycerate dehydrogenase-like enzyme
VRILLASPVDPAAATRLAAAHDVRRLGAGTDLPVDLAGAIADREVVVLRSGVVLDGDTLAAAERLRLVVRAGSGVDNIDLDSAASSGIRVVRVPGMSAPPVAEMTFALLLSLARNVALADRLVRAGHWPKPELGGHLVRGKVLGVVGAGNIGSEVGRMATAWGMRVLGCVAQPSAAVADRLAAHRIELCGFDELVAQAHFVSMHVPLDDSTFHMVDAAVLERMRPGSLLVNMARGGVVDEKALYEALLDRRTVAGAALDVHEAEGEGVVPLLAELPNVVLTPHIGAMALDSQRLIGDRVVALIDAFDAGRLDEEVRDGEHVV